MYNLRFSVHRSRVLCNLRRYRRWLQNVLPMPLSRVATVLRVEMPFECDIM